MHRQQIRPSIADLQHLDDGSDQSESDDDVPEYAPAATPIRGEPPPIVGAGSSKTASSSKSASSSTSKLTSEGTKTARKVVRIAPSSSTRVHDIEGRTTSRFAASKRTAAQESEVERRQGPERFRFTPEQDDEKEWQADLDEEPSQSPLIGTIQERAGLGSSGPSKRTEHKSLSRFALSKRDERGREKPTEGNGWASQADDGQWLDEDGQPMSAFRKNRLLKQGLRPPAVGASQTAEHAPAKPLVQPLSAPSPASKSGIDDLMTSVSLENEVRLSAMSAEDVAQDLSDLRESLGADLLEKLKGRRGGEKVVAAEAPGGASVGIEHHPAVATRRDEEQTSEQIRAKYFPNEPDKLPLSLRWTQSLDKESDLATASSTLRFHFSGRAIGSGQLSEEETRLAGLHHHGSEQNRAGYTVDELLHLARSTLPSQRILALQTLDRIMSQYPEMPADCGIESEEGKACRALADANVRGKAGVIASWYIEERQVSVRLAALQCLRTCLFTTLAGPRPVRGVVVQGGRPDKAKERAYDQSGDDFALSLLPLLGHFLLGQTTASSDVEISLDILRFLCARSVAVCSAFVQRRDYTVVLVETCISRRQWPATSAKERPLALGLDILLTLVSSKRVNAATLVERGHIDPLLRFLAVPPWQMEERQDYDQWIYFDLAMQIYSALATYGLYSDVLQKGYSVLPAIQDWVRTFESGDKSQLQALSSCLSCLGVWTVCAIDPHQTQGHHDIGWSHVSDWWDCAVQCANRLSTLPHLSNTPLAICAAAHSIALLDGWLECASHNKQLVQERVAEEVTRSMDHLLTLVSHLCASITQSSNRLSLHLSHSDSQPFWMESLAEALQLAELCRGADQVMRFIAHTSAVTQVPATATEVLLDTARALLQASFWSGLDRLDAQAAGVAKPRQRIASFCCRAVQSVSANAGSGARLAVLQALAVLRTGDEELASWLINTVLPANTEGVMQTNLSVLQPFLNEMLHSTVAPNGPPMHVISTSLSTTDTLFVGVTRLRNEEEEIDPLSGADLWKSAASGLPLRRDWPLAALDDLLHSGNCASLNRKDALPADWDANERQIVVSTLGLGTQLWNGVLDEPSAGSDVLPSAAEVHLALIKVFMLEEGQSQDPRASGLITGKDLYRDAEVAKLLDGLYALARQMDGSRRSDDLERAAKRQFGPSMPFYQLYTSLLGLYDGTSFGFEPFARALLLPLSNEYASDYGRLFWIDYGHCLPTVRTKIADLPYPNLTSFLRGNEDEGVVRAMVDALMSQTITREANEALFQIAIQQVAHVAWAQGEESERGAMLLKAIAQRLAGKDASLLAALGSDGIVAGPDGEAEKKRRGGILAGLGSTVVW